MKLLLFIYLLTIILTTNLNSQVVITRADFNQPPAFVDRGIFSYQEVDIPSFGENQNWEAPILQNSNTYTSTFKELLDKDAVFTNAHNYNWGIRKKLGYNVEQTMFYAVDDEGWHFLGNRNYQSMTYSIAEYTGNGNDRFTFLDGDYLLEDRLDFIKFPLEYGDEWEQTYVNKYDFMITVISLGYNRTSGIIETTINKKNHVVGSGAFKVSFSSKDFVNDVLLVERITTTTDSVFIDGIEAPKIILEVFGTTQGERDVDTSYYFYSPNHFHHIARYGLSSGIVSLSAQTPIETNVELETTTSNILMFPNPLTDNQTLTIESNGQTISNVVITDVNGASVFRMNNHNQTNNMNINLPNNISSGVYFVKTTDETGGIVDIRKLIIE